MARRPDGSRPAGCLEVQPPVPGFGREQGRRVLQEYQPLGLALDTPQERALIGDVDECADCPKGDSFSHLNLRLHADPD